MAAAVRHRLRGHELHVPAHFGAELLSALGRLQRLRDHPPPPPNLAARGKGAAGRGRIVTPATNPGTVTEADFQGAVVEYAQITGWRVAHWRPARSSRRWRTPVQFDGQGFPDLIMTRDRLVIVELKSPRGRLTDHQQTWIDTLVDAGVEAYVWKPKDWDIIEAVLP